MAKRKTPKNITERPVEPVKDSDLVLTSLAEKDAQLRRLLKAEHNEWAGVIGRKVFRQIADDIRQELRGEKEVEMGGPIDD